MFLQTLTTAALAGMTPAEYLNRPVTWDGLTSTTKGVVALLPVKNKPDLLELHLVQRRSALLQRALASAPYPYTEPTPKDQYRDLLRSLGVTELQVADALGFKNVPSMYNSGRYKRGEIQRDVLRLFALFAPPISAETASRYNTPPPPQR